MTPSPESVARRDRRLSLLAAIIYLAAMASALAFVPGCTATAGGVGHAAGEGAAAGALGELVAWLDSPDGRARVDEVGGRVGSAVVAGVSASAPAAIDAAVARAVASAASGIRTELPGMVDAAVSAAEGRVVAAIGNVVGGAKDATVKALADDVADLRRRQASGESLTWWQWVVMTVGGAIATAIGGKGALDARNARREIARDRERGRGVRQPDGA